MYNNASGPNFYLKCYLFPEADCPLKWPSGLCMARGYRLPTAFTLPTDHCVWFPQGATAHFEIERFFRGNLEADFRKKLNIFGAAVNGFISVKRDANKKPSIFLESQTDFKVTFDQFLVKTMENFVLYLDAKHLFHFKKIIR